MHGREWMGWDRTKVSHFLHPVPTDHPIPLYHGTKWTDWDTYQSVTLAIPCPHCPSYPTVPWDGIDGLGYIPKCPTCYTLSPLSIPSHCTMEWNGWTGIHTEVSHLLHPVPPIAVLGGLITLTSYMISPAVVQVPKIEWIERALVWLSINMPTGSTKSPLYQYLHGILIRVRGKCGYTSRDPEWLVGDATCGILWQQMEVVCLACMMS